MAGEHTFRCEFKGAVVSVTTEHQVQFFFSLTAEQPTGVGAGSVESAGAGLIHAKVVTEEEMKR